MTGLVILLFIVCFYFVPLVVAMNRDHPQVTSIAVVNVFLGWTLIGWVAALAWACQGFSERPRVIDSEPAYHPRTTRRRRH